MNSNANAPQVYSDRGLKAEVRVTADAVETHWSGKSEQRNPKQFMMPVLVETLEMGEKLKKPVVWNFFDMDYMNSSSVMPVIKALEQARKDRREVRVFYDKSKKWQELSFSALRVFATRDGRIQVTGME